MSFSNFRGRKLYKGEGSVKFVTYEIFESYGRVFKIREYCLR